MVRRSIAALLASTAIASASPPDEPDDYAEEDDGSPAFNMLGFRLGIGALPLAGHRTTTLSLGLGVEHPVLGKTRMFGEYEWLWLSHGDERAMDSVVIRPERFGNGHRVSLGLRRELVAKNVSRSVRLFVDGELGGGLALAQESVVGLLVVPAGFAGMRVGYDIYSRSDTSPSSTFEAELLVRAIAIDGGIGVMTGLGMLWGN